MQSQVVTFFRAKTYHLVLLIWSMFALQGGTCSILKILTTLVIKLAITFTRIIFVNRGQI